ncbi:MAG TPA: HAMP domain-containing protein, partial [Micromonosporaceae bacterium]
MPDAPGTDSTLPVPEPEPSGWPLSVDWRTAGGSPIQPRPIEAAQTVQTHPPETVTPPDPAARVTEAITPGQRPSWTAHPPQVPSSHQRAPKAPAPSAQYAPPWVTPRPRGAARFMRTLNARAVVATCSAALISVLVTALVAFPLALRSANDAVRSGLADKASLAASLINPPSGTGAGAPIRAGVVVRQLRRQDVDAFLVHNGRSDPAGLPAGLISQITSGHNITGATRLVGGRRMLIEGRATGGGDGVVLVAPAVPVTARNVVVRIGLALLAGLLAGLLVGALLARRLARPIRNAAAVAARLSAGDRSVRVRPEPPAEAEDLAHAINALAAALATSEGRQREFLLSISHEL